MKLFIYELKNSILNMIRLIWGILIALAVSVAILIAAISIRNNREISLMTFGVTGAGANTIAMISVAYLLSGIFVKY